MSDLDLAATLFWQFMFLLFSLLLRTEKEK